MTDSCFYQSFPRLVARHPIRARWRKEAGDISVTRVFFFFGASESASGCIVLWKPQLWAVSWLPVPPAPPLHQPRSAPPPRVDGAARLRDAPGVVGHPPPGSVRAGAGGGAPCPTRGPSTSVTANVKRCSPCRWRESAGRQQRPQQPLPGESHGSPQHHGRLHLQVWSHVRWVEADGSSRVLSRHGRRHGHSGSLNAQIIHQVSSRIRSKLAFQTQQNKFVNWQGDAEFRGEDFTATVTLGNPDVLVWLRYCSDHYLQSITPSLALGGGSGYHRRPGEEGSVMSLVGRYTGSNYVATVTLGSAGTHASYYHKANDQLQLGVEFEASTRMQDTSVSFGYQLDVPKANLQFKGSVDSNWVVGATLEKKLLPLPLSLVLCSFLNHRKNKFQCGFGVTIG
ncbi:hypothetical protein INR49_009258 [Caranx melampygus]|nr:hypothetical protein INR49_009258 [Caranx melampygus]